MCLWYRIQALQNNINNIAINNLQNNINNIAINNEWKKLTQTSKQFGYQ